MKIKILLLLFFYVRILFLRKDCLFIQIIYQITILIHPSMAGALIAQNQVNGKETVV
jgi:hypothetical protein